MRCPPARPRRWAWARNKHKRVRVLTLAFLSVPEGLRQYLAGLLGRGFIWGELQRMAGDNPAYLLGL